MKKRIVFELDETLLHGRIRASREFFERMGNESFSLKDLDSLLERYGMTHEMLDFDSLSSFLSEQLGFPISSDVIRDWDHFLSKYRYEVLPGTYEVLDELKKSGVSLAVLTNWFRSTQISKINEHGLASYFDDIYTGEGIIKPNKSAYLHAIDGFDRKESLFVGNSINCDYVGPRSLGVESLLYDELDQNHYSVCKIKSLEELRKVVR